MTRPRVSSLRLRLLTKEIPTRYTTPLPHLARTRVLTGAHLDRLLATPEHSPETTARMRRRIMTRLCGLGLVDTLARRIGGARAGSAGHVYTLTSAGHVFLALLNGEPSPGRRRHARNPGELFLTHALAISGIYVDLIEHSRSGAFQMASFTTEPHCWHPVGNGAYLRPDAYAVLAAAKHADCWWLEIDQATESTPRLRAKTRAYRDFLTSGGVGPDHVPPRVLITTPDQTRADTITRAVTSTATDSGALITVTTHDQAARCMVTELHQP